MYYIKKYLSQDGLMELIKIFYREKYVAGKRIYVNILMKKFG